MSSKPASTSKLAAARDAALVFALLWLAFGAILTVRRWYDRQQPAACWVSMRMRWSEPAGEWLGVRLHRAYRTQSECVAATPVTMLETVGNESYRMQWACVKVWRVR
jgi:uncharacterized membrane protein YhaH (DUF805 family)